MFVCMGICFHYGLLLLTSEDLTTVLCLLVCFDLFSGFLTVSESYIRTTGLYKFTRKYTLKHSSDVY